MSYVMCPHPASFSVVVPVGSCIEVSLVAHICHGLGALFLARYSGSQSNKLWLLLSRGFILFHQANRREEERAISIDSERFVEIFFTLVVLIFSGSGDRNIGV